MLFFLFSIVKRKHLESLACLSDAKCNKILSTTEKDGEINPIYYYFRLQYQWIYDMLESSQKQTKSSFILDNDHIVIKSDESSIPLQTQPQGPFIVKQTNNQSENLGQVSDMLLLQTDDIRIMALTYTNGYVQNYILGGGISGQWIMPKGKTNKNTWQKMVIIYIYTKEICKQGNNNPVYIKIKKIKNEKNLYQTLYNGI